MSRWWVVLVASGCGERQIDGVLLPSPRGVAFVAGVDHTYFPLPPGATRSYAGDGDETSAVEVLAASRQVNGVAATAVREVVTIQGDVTDQIDRWYAQDADGNVWILGEDHCHVEAGECLAHPLLWEWGVDGAKPGIVLWASPAIGDGAYFRAYQPLVVEDVAQVLAVGESATVPAGTYDDCVRLQEESRLDENDQAQVVYCAGVGVVLAQAEGVFLRQLVSTGGP